MGFDAKADTSVDFLYRFMITFIPSNWTVITY